ncbi:MAG: AbrB/MazE/SpoVT family DNA-binding domain-containing protein [Methylococcales bacterium]|nr:AbrB/MazE/SpoVT family DNA-binding domain-containing protein [Methylococcales bacterium]
MLAKLTSKNQLTLPKSVVTLVGKADYYDVVVESGRIILTPVRIQQADAVREKLDALGIDEQDVLDAIQWARQPPA